MPIRDAPQVLWGENLENVTTFPYPIEGAVSRRRRRTGYETVQSLTGVEDAANAGTDFTLSGSLDFIEAKDRTTPTVASGWSGSTGVQAFLDWARDKRTFRFVPSAQTPNFWVDGCTLLEPMGADPGPKDDGTRRLDFVFHNAVMDFGWALRGVAVELGPGYIHAIGSRPRLEHQRANTANYHSKAGRVAAGTSNVPRTRNFDFTRIQLVVEPENFGLWLASGTPVLTAGQTDPFGGTAAYIVNDDDAAAFETLFYTVNFGSGGEKAFSMFMKQGTASASWFRLRDSTAGVDRHRVDVTWSGGVPTLATQSGSGTLFPVENFGGGWWRVSASATGVVAANQNVFEFAPGTFGVGATGTGLFFGANAWNASLVLKYLGPEPIAGIQTWLQESVIRNDVLRSEELDNASWVKNNVTITANAVQSPREGTDVTADKLVETAVNSTHYVQSPAVILAGEYLFAAAYFKKAERSRFFFRCVDAGATTGFGMNINLGTRTFTNENIGTGTLLSRRLLELGGGWFRAEMVGRIDPATTTTAHLFIYMQDDTGAGSYLGDVTKGFYAWGLQLGRSVSTVAPPPHMSYVATTTAAIALTGDVSELDWPWPSQRFWGYAKFIELGEARRASFVDVFSIGERVGSVPLVRLITGAGTVGISPFWRFNWTADGGVNQSAAIAVATPEPGDTVELFFRLDADGTSRLVQAINGVAASEVTGSGGAALATTQNLARRLRLLGAQAGLVNLKLGFAPWITTLSQARWT